MSADFLGVGWAFPVGLDDGGVALARYEESVRQAIWIILGTAKGERAMRPDFGSGLHELLFAPADPTTAGRVASAVREDLLRWEPRIDVRDVSARVDGANDTLSIEIEYRVRSTNNVFNVVYPFYLQSGLRGGLGADEAGAAGV
jgi:hypothetical protein